MHHTGANAVASQQGGGSGGRRTRQRWFIVTVTLGALLLVAAVGWACTVGQMKGNLWFSGSTGTNVFEHGLGADLGDCPEPEVGDNHDPDDNVTEFDRGDVVCVQAKRLQVVRTGASTPDEENSDDENQHFMRLYELKYAPTYPDDPPVDPLNDQQQDDLDGNLCHQSRQTLPNRSRDDGLYKASTADNYGWEDQKTVLDMPQGTYTVCAATVAPPAVGVMTDAGGTGVPFSYYDAGPDGDPTTEHGSITVTGAP